MRFNWWFYAQYNEDLSQPLQWIIHYIRINNLQFPNDLNPFLPGIRTGTIAVGVVITGPSGQGSADYEDIISGGWVSVSEDGSETIFEFELTTEMGRTISGTFQGTI